VSENLLRLRARALEKGRKAFRDGDPEGLHDLRVALRREAATAAALGKRKIERRLRSLVKVLSPLRQFEVDRQILGRLRSLGVISEDAAAGLDARWDALFAAGVRKAASVAESGKMRRAIRRLRRLIRRPPAGLTRLLARERRKVENRLIPASENATDRQLHRFRIAVKRARYLAEDLAACGVEGLSDTIDREKELQDALGRWNDVRLFRERLLDERRQAEERGAVTFAAELDHVTAALEGTVASARREALAAAGRFARVLSFLEQSA